MSPASRSEPWPSRITLFQVAPAASGCRTRYLCHCKRSLPVGRITVRLSRVNRLQASLASVLATVLATILATVHATVLATVSRGLRLEVSTQSSPVYFFTFEQGATPGKHSRRSHASAGLILPDRTRREKNLGSVVPGKRFPQKVRCRGGLGNLRTRADTHKEIRRESRKEIRSVVPDGSSIYEVST